MIRALFAREGLTITRLLLERGADPNVRRHPGISVWRLTNNAIRQESRGQYSGMTNPEELQRLLEEFGGKR